MLRIQAKKQSSFYVCASCRRQHQHDLAHLRFAGRVQITNLSSTSRVSSSSSASLSKLPTLRRAQNRTEYHSAISRLTRSEARGYTSWGKFGSQSVPGQTNSSWGTSSKISQPIGTPSSSPAWGGPTKIPPATETSAWGGAGSNSLAPTTPGWAGGASAVSPLPSRPRTSVPWEADPSLDPTSTPTATPASLRTGPDPGPAHSAAKGSVHDAPVSARGPDTANTTSSSGSPPASRRLPNTPWGAKAFNASAPSVGSPGKHTLGVPPGAMSSKPAFGAPPTATLGTFGSSGGFIPGKPTFGGSSAWTPTSDRSPIPAKLTSDDSGMLQAKSTSGIDASTWKQHDSKSPVLAPEKPNIQDIKPAASQPLSGSRSSDKSLDAMFSKSPNRKPPPGSEFPQLRRASSKDDLFESMSPFKLPPRKQWRSNSSPSGSHQNASTREPSAPSPDQKDRGDGKGPNRTRFSDWDASPKSKSSTQHTGGKNSTARLKSKDQFEVMREAVVTQEKANKYDQSDWGDGPSTTGASKPTRPVRDHNTAPPDSTPRGKAPGREAASRGRGRGAVRGDRDYRGLARDFDEDEDANAARSRANKGRRSGGGRGRNTDEDEGSDDFDDQRDARAIQKQRQRRLAEKRAAQERAAPKAIVLPEFITVYDLAEALRIKPVQFLYDLEQLGFENTLLDSVMTGETAALVAAEYGFEPTVEHGAKVDLRPRPPPEDPTGVPSRPPIVTIMGHVDHGKTTILDTLRKSSIVAQEFGGITQHIGAFSVKLSMGKTITFLDTPGHAAFLSMRQRGANITDIVVLVVAVDDSVKPQTIEAIRHAQSAKVPMIVAINKIDVDNTPNRLEMVKQDLANNGVEVEDYGGDVQAVAISGKTGLGMRDLEDAILTLSEVLDVRAESDGMAEGWVLETSVKTEGKAATILVKRGTLHIGDMIVAGTSYTKVRIMRNEAGVDVEEAGPGTPIEIYGSWKGEPMAGDMVLQAPTEPKAQAAVDYRQEIADRAIAAAQNAEREAQDREKAEREALKKKMEEAEAAGESEEAEPAEVGPKVVSIIVRGDVMGSVEAVSMAILEIGNNEVRPRILRSAPGQITESDVDHMATAKGAIVNFNNPIPGHVLQRASQAGVVILDHHIIYESVQAVKDLLSAQLPPIYTQRVVAEALVAKVFPINITKRIYKNIAGVKVTKEKVTRGGQYRVMRDGEEIYKGKLSALKQNKDDVSEVKRGVECGMMFDNFDAFQEGDLIQLYEDIEQKRYL